MENKTKQTSHMLTGKNAMLLDLCVLLVKEANLKGRRRATITGISNIEQLPNEKSSSKSGTTSTFGLAMTLAMDTAPIVTFAEVITAKLTEGQKKRLVGSISGFFTKIEFRDAVDAMDILDKDETLKESVMTRIKSHFKIILGYTIE
ncbi:uncharacterized protein [Leptinotarsa decemlineata]|uniref:uncharacterized protein n=1 Tax=Leptinotarsa decemlineata TaxID=7539 RepID=UPI000C2533BB|nr:uncharacterized protein LOC111504489 [Leptinotarsa decemlineata]